MSISAAQTAARVLEALEKGERICTAVVVKASDPSLIGRRWWSVGGRTRGTLGSRSLDGSVAAAFASIFPPGQSHGALSRTFAHELNRAATADHADHGDHGDHGDNPGTADHADHDGPEATATVYLELHGPPAKLVIVGAGHIAVPLATMGAMLGLRVEVLDDRADFAAAERFRDAAAVRVIDFRDPFAKTPLDQADHVVLVTRGHSFDYECLVRLLRMESPPDYIGMIGSRRRVRATHAQLAAEGFGTQDMARVRAPVGLDLGGQSPAEIAVSVVAEIVMLRAGGTGEPLVAKERVVERFFGRVQGR